MNRKEHPMKSHPWLLTILFGAALALNGCSGNISVTGTVKFDDGAPLTRGTVVMESDQVRATGEIDANGAFRLGSSSPGSGTKPGKYRAWIVGSEEDFFNETTGKNTTQRHIDPKYGSPSKSGLVYDINSGNKVIDIVVSRPDAAGK